MPRLRQRSMRRSTARDEPRLVGSRRSGQVSALYARELGLAIPASRRYPRRSGPTFARPSHDRPRSRVFTVPSGTTIATASCRAYTMPIQCGSDPPSCRRGAGTLPPGAAPVLNSPSTRPAPRSTRDPKAICEASWRRNARRSPDEPPLYCVRSVYWMLPSTVSRQVCPVVCPPCALPFGGRHLQGFRGDALSSVDMRASGTLGPAQRLWVRGAGSAPGMSHC